MWVKPSRHWRLPQTNLFLQGRDHPVAMPRGLTAIAALREAGALVAAGADNVQDPFNLVGRSDPLETAALLVMAGHELPHDPGVLSERRPFCDVVRPDKAR